MSQRQQLERIMEIDRQIRNGKYPSADDLARGLEVSRRVIFNDRNFMLHRLGAPIVFDRKRRGWKYADESWVLPGIIVTEGELLAFFLSIEVARRYLGTSMEETLRSAVERLAQNINALVTIKLENLRTFYTFTGSTLLDTNERALYDLHQAISENQKIWMRYYTASRDEHTERTVHPLHLSNLRGDWYLTAFDELRQTIRNFAVGRMEEWKVLKEHFQRDPAFSVVEHLQTAFQAERGLETMDVAIRFAAGTARYIRERTWHASQTIEELPDGGLIIRFTTSGMGEVKRWVLQYGSNAEVLSPAVLRQDCIEEVRKLRGMYGV